MYCYKKSETQVVHDIGPAPNLCFIEDGEENVWFFFSVKSHFKLAALLPLHMKLGLEKLGCERVWGTFV